MLTDLDDLPIHQTPSGLSHVMGGHPNAYDRFWFNAYREDLFVGVALGIYPNRGVIDAAVSTVRSGTQRSVFASGRLEGRPTTVGPISIELVEPMRTAVIRVDAPDHGLRAEMMFRARTFAVEEPRQTRYDGERVFMDVTRATQLGAWSGSIEVDGEHIDLEAPSTLGTKDRSWGIRPVGEPVVAAPSPSAPQLFFLWAPINFEDSGLHFSTFEDDKGVAWSKIGVRLDLLEPGDSPVDTDGTHPLRAVDGRVSFTPGTRRASRASIDVLDADGVASTVVLDPVLTFRMRGAGYLHPVYAHGRYHGDLVVDGEVHAVQDLDTLSIHDVHIQQVVRASWGERRGIGVLEQLVIGPHAPSGLKGLLDGAP